MEHPSFLRRAFAWFLDNLVVGFLAFVVLWVTDGATGVITALGEPAADPFAVLGSFHIVLLVLAIQFVYYGALWSRDGQSLGKRAMGLRVAGRDGGLLSFPSAGLRGTFGYWVSGTLFYLGFLWALFDSRDETWHDKLFNSEVVVA